MRKMSKPQALSLICTDDIVRNPSTGRKVRVHLTERGNTYTGISGKDVETGTDVVFSVRNTVRMSVWTD